MPDDVQHAVRRLLSLHAPPSLQAHAALRGRPPAGLFLIAAAVDADATLREVQAAAEQLPHAPRVAWPRTSRELVALLQEAMRSDATRSGGGTGDEPPPPSQPLTIFEYAVAASAPVQALLRAALADGRMLVVVVDEHGPPAALSALRTTRVARRVAAAPRQADWSQLGGMDAVKRRLRVALEWPRQHAPTMARLGVRASRGVLLHGPPGCGKTSLVRVVAAAGGAHFESLSPADVYSCYVGEAERRVRAAFAEARARAPAILFLDELDALAGARTAGGGGRGSVDVSQRVLATLLTEMDGVTRSPGVTVVAATNRLDAVDSALKRPGRFDDLIHVPLPAAGDRRHILSLWMRSVAVAPDVDVEWLVQRTDGRSPAEILGLCNEAALAGARGYWSDDTLVDKPRVRRADIEWALKSSTAGA